jgi:hypothetical protein
MGDKLMESAVRAYHRWGGKEQPSNNDSGRFKYEEKDYLVLANVNGVLAIFEVSPAGLRRLSGYLEQEIRAAWERPGARGYRSPIQKPILVAKLSKNG